MLPQDIVQSWEKRKISRPERDALLICQMTTKAEVDSVLASLPEKVRGEVAASVRSLAETGSVAGHLGPREARAVGKIQSDNQETLAARVVPAIRSWCEKNSV